MRTTPGISVFVVANSNELTVILVPSGTTCEAAKPFSPGLILMELMDNDVSGSSDALERNPMLFGMLFS